MDSRIIKKQIQDQMKPEFGNVEISTKSFRFTGEKEKIFSPPNIVWLKTYYTRILKTQSIPSIEDFSRTDINMSQILLPSNTYGAVVDYNNTKYLNAMYSTWVLSEQDQVIKGTLGSGGLFAASEGLRIAIYKRFLKLRATPTDSNVSGSIRDIPPDLIYSTLSSPSLFSIS